MGTCNSSASSVSLDLRRYAIHIFNRVFLCFLLCPLLSLLSTYAVADHEVLSQDRTTTISEKMHFTGEVARVFMVVASNGTLLESKQVAWIEQSEEQEVSCIGRIAVPPGPITLQILFVIFGQKGEVRSAFKTIESEELSPADQLTLAELQDRLVERRGVLRKLMGEIQSQSERLRTLQEDADAIANVSKIVNTEDELSEVRAKIQRIDAGFASIRQRTQLMKTRTAPLNSRKRETELVRQLTNLSATLAVTEASALRGISAASAELKQKLQLIEEARDDHVLVLEEELAALQRRRQKNQGAQKP